MTQYEGRISLLCLLNIKLQLCEIMQSLSQRARKLHLVTTERNENRESLGGRATVKRALLIKKG